MVLSRAHAVGIATAIAGSLLVLALVVLMNNPFAQRDKASALVGSSIAVVKKEKPKPKEVVRKPEPPKRKARAAPTPLLGLDSSLRSEEHTSELQSLMRISYAVFCLKKKRTRQHEDKN